MQASLLIETTRGQTPENHHFGSIAVADAQGRLLAHAGDPHRVSFTRSTLKALQALPLMLSGAPGQWGWGSEKLAMLCASHSGEANHVEQVEGMLASVDLSYKRLKCGCHVPYFVEQGLGPAPAVFDERHHNCSGKHAGFVALCVHRGWDLNAYLEPVHPLQQAIRTAVADVAGLGESALAMGIDGCSAPNYAMPLVALARGYARLASGGRDPRYGEAFAALSHAMVAHPELVSGTGRNDAAFMRAGRGDWVTKVGADGVQVVASRSRGEALAIKISDGSKPALFAATVEALDQLGWLDERQRAELEPWRARDIVSVRGAIVGARRSVFRLQAST